MAAALIQGTPFAVGGKLVSIIDHVGPASYTQVTTGSPPTGGDSITAAEFGLGFIDAIFACLSDDGQYEGVATPGVQSGGEPSTWILEWKIAHTGAEVAGTTNLSGRTVRLIAIGG